MSEYLLSKSACRGSRWTALIPLPVARDLMFVFPADTPTTEISVRRILGRVQRACNRHGLIACLERSLGPTSVIEQRKPQDSENAPHDPVVVTPVLRQPPLPAYDHRRCRPASIKPDDGPAIPLFGLSLRLGTSARRAPDGMAKFAQRANPPQQSPWTNIGIPSA